MIRRSCRIRGPQREEPAPKKPKPKDEPEESDESDVEIKSDEEESGEPINFMDKPYRGIVRLSNGNIDNYACAFNQFVKFPDEQNVAVVGGNYLDVYACPLKQAKFRHVLGITVEADENEVEDDFYTVAWCCETINGAKKFRIVCGGKTGTLTVFDFDKGTICRTLYGSQLGVNDIRTSPINPTLVATACIDGSIRVFDIRAEACLLLIGGKKSHYGNVLSIDWSPDGKSLVAGGYDHYVTKWDLSTQEIQNHLNACNEELDEGLPISRKNFPSSDPLLDEARSIYDNKGYTMFIHNPVYAINCVHFDSVDCVRYIDPHQTNKLDFIISKACGKESRLVCWNFGRIDGGKEHVDPGEPRICHKQYYQRPINEGKAYFNKFGLDPLRRWLVIGGSDGTCQFFYLGHETPDKMGPDYTVKVTATLRTPRQVAFSDEGRIMVMVGDRGLLVRMDRNDFDNPKTKDLWGRVV